MRRLFVLCTLTGVLGMAGVAIADPSLSNVPRHRHFVETPTGERVEVGPRFCDNPNLQQAFNQFHANTHSHTLLNGAPIGAIGPVAPGLHNGSGGELKFGPC